MSRLDMVLVPYVTHSWHSAELPHGSKHWVASECCFECWPSKESCTDNWSVNSKMQHNTVFIEYLYRIALFHTRIAHRVSSLRNFKFHDLCRSSGAVVTTAPDDRHKSWNLKLRKEETLCAIMVLYSSSCIGDWALFAGWNNLSLYCYFFFFRIKLLLSSLHKILISPCSLLEAYLWALSSASFQNTFEITLPRHY